MTSFLRRVLGLAPGEQPSPPPTPRPITPADPTDDVILGFTLDDTPTNRAIPLAWTLKFDDVLDADMLHDSLSRLLSIGNWRKLGGRIRKNVWLYLALIPGPI